MRRKAREPSLGPAGPRMPRMFSQERVRACVVARCSASSRKGRQGANVGVELVALHRGRGSDVPQPVPVHRRIAEVVRPSSGSEKRALGTVWVESPREARGGWTGA